MERKLLRSLNILDNWLFSLQAFCCSRTRNYFIDLNITHSHYFSSIWVHQERLKITKKFTFNSTKLSYMVTSLRLGPPWFDSRNCTQNFLLSNASILALGPCLVFTAYRWLFQGGNGGRDLNLKALLHKVP